MRKRKMKHYQLAEMVGITPVYLSDILNGKRDGEKAQEHIRTIKEILNIR
nr:helix-turn-helix transcriptional regulator [Enterococcus ureasiticus]